MGEGEREDAMTTRAAIYVRKSNESKASEDAKSITLQKENARGFATAQGWTVDPAHVYEDDAISGAEFDEKRRPQFAALIAAAKREPRPFDCLVIRDQTRFGRDQKWTSFYLQELAEAGVRIFCYADGGQEIKLDEPTAILIAQLKAYLAAGERLAGVSRAKEKGRKLAEQGYVAGAKTFGYDHREVLGGDGRRSHVVRVINPEQAATVRRIFALYATDGVGTIKIAGLLNQEGVPSPGAVRSPGGVAVKWSASAVRELLGNELYSGVAVYGRRHRLYKGKRRRVRQSESQIIRVDLPDLRIVDSDTWARVQARRERNAQAFLRNPKGTIVGRLAKTDFESRYLLSGLARCATCGGSMVASTRLSGNGEGTNVYYRCNAAWKQGDTVCTNKAGVPAEIIEGAVLSAVGAQLDPDLVVQTVEAVIAASRQAQPNPEERQAGLERELSKTEAAIARLVDAVAEGSGDAPEALVTRLKTEEARARAIRDELAAVKRAGTELTPGAVRGVLSRETSAVLDLLGSFTRSAPARARAALRQLGVKVEVGPAAGKRGAREVSLTVSGSYRGLLKGAVLSADEYSTVFLDAEPSVSGRRLISTCHPQYPRVPIQGGSSGEEEASQPESPTDGPTGCSDTPPRCFSGP
jgi:DNA invertase Pin-like site-specific DNA recombinase